MGVRLYIEYACLLLIIRLPIMTFLFCVCSLILSFCSVSVLLGRFYEIKACINFAFIHIQFLLTGPRQLRIAARNMPLSDAKGKYFWEYNATNRTQVQYAKNPFSWNTQKMMKRKQDQTTCLVIKKIKKLVFDAEKCGTRKSFICEAQIIS